MAKLAIGSILAGFEEQVSEGAYPAGLNGIGATWGGDPDGTDEGLVLGHPGSGIKKSGLDIGFAAPREDMPTVATDFTRAMGGRLPTEIDSFSFSWPFCGSRRATTVTTPVDGDFVPLVGVDAILAAFGLNGAASGTPGDLFKYDVAAVEKMAALLYFWGNRVELLDCVGETLSIVWTAGETGIATASFKVGSVNDPTSDGVTPASPLTPVPTYGAQLTVSPPIVEGVAHIWGATRGFETLTLESAPKVETFGDSNIANSGKVVEHTDRETTIKARIYVDDAGSGEVFELNQLLADVTGSLSPLSFQVGSDVVGASPGPPALAVGVTVDQPVLRNFKPIQIGTKAGVEVELLCSQTSDKQEVDIEFR